MELKKVTFVTLSALIIGLVGCAVSKAVSKSESANLTTSNVVSYIEKSTDKAKHSRESVYGKDVNTYDLKVLNQVRKGDFYLSLKQYRLKVKETSEVLGSIDNLYKSKDNIQKLESSLHDTFSSYDGILESYSETVKNEKVLSLLASYHQLVEEDRALLLKSKTSAVDKLNYESRQLREDEIERHIERSKILEQTYTSKKSVEQEEEKQYILDGVYTQEVRNAKSKLSIMLTQTAYKQLKIQKDEWEEFRIPLRKAVKDLTVVSSESSSMDTFALDEVAYLENIIRFSNAMEKEMSKVPYDEERLNALREQARKIK